MKKIILYHGTSTKYLPDILKNGIQPRGKLNKESNWKENNSKQDFVYLTDTYPIYYAGVLSTSEYKSVILKVEVNTQKLFPDEDFIAQYMCYHDDKLDLTTVTNEIDLYNYKQSWKQSLIGLGTVAHLGQIKSKQILDYRILEDNKVLSDGLEPCITILNKQICGKKYMDLIKYVFNEIEYNPFDIERQEMLDIFNKLKIDTK